MQIIKRAYVKLFPLLSLRRFILDQIINWTLYLGYYIAIIAIATFLTIISLHFLGSIFINFFNIPMTSHNVPMSSNEHYLVSCLLGCVVVTIIAIIVGIFAAIGECIYYTDFTVWLKEQQNYIKDLDQGIQDIEAVHIPIIPTTIQEYSYKFFPLGSVNRYIARLFLYCFIFMFLCYFQIKLAILLPLNAPIIVKWFAGTVIQVIIGLIIFLIYQCTVDSCSEEWKKYKNQVESSISKR